MGSGGIKKHIFAVIMAGGGGERFWPMSRQARPKQMLDIFGGRSMLRSTVDRISPLASPDRLLVITNELQAPLVRKELPEITESSIVAEPFGRDTAACIALGAAMVLKRDPGGTMVVLPADHVIKDRDGLNQNLEDACRMAGRDDRLVTLGVKPTGPSTGYGYIHCGDKIESELKTDFWKVKEFTEKPDIITARNYLKRGGYFWNSGMFVWKASVIAGEFRKHMPSLYSGFAKIKESLDTPEQEDVIRGVYNGLEKISIDYGIMEKAQNVVMARADFDWDDAGAWTAVERHYAPDRDGNFIIGEAVTMDSERCIILSGEGIVGCLGVKDLIIIKTSDAVLVCPKNRAQDVKKVVSLLKESAAWKRYI